LYNAYGHTAIGLEKEYKVDARDFNKKVYNRHVIDHLYNFLDTSVEFENNAQIVRRILSMGHDVELFSNSPLDWSVPVAEKIDPRVKTGTYEKPKIESYLKFDYSRDYVFVDDKMCNLMPVIFLENWIPVHFSEQKESAWVKTISSLEELNSSGTLRK
jgi:hypothetical protein